MTNEVDHTDRQRGWPPNQFHPVYDSFRDWLDNEAPAEPTPNREAKSRNLRKFVTKLRRPTVVE